jgi:hypothetical protein
MWKEEIKTLNKGLGGQYTLLATFRVTPVHVFEQKQGRDLTCHSFFPERSLSLSVMLLLSIDMLQKLLSYPLLLRHATLNE